MKMTISASGTSAAGQWAHSGTRSRRRRRVRLPDRQRQPVVSARARLTVPATVHPRPPSIMTADASAPPAANLLRLAEVEAALIPLYLVVMSARQPNDYGVAWLLDDPGRWSPGVSPEHRWVEKQLRRGRACFLYLEAGREGSVAACTDGAWVTSLEREEWEEDGETWSELVWAPAEDEISDAGMRDPARGGSYSASGWTRRRRRKSPARYAPCWILPSPRPSRNEPVSAATSTPKDGGRPSSSAQSPRTPRDGGRRHGPWRSFRPRHKARGCR